MALQDGRSLADQRAAVDGAYAEVMTSAGHRKPRGRTARTHPRSATRSVEPVAAEVIGSAIAPADVGPAADLTPLDHDGLIPIAVLTAAWAIAAVVLLFMRTDLADSGRTWWLWTCVAGFGLGLLGFAYSRHRRDALRDNA